MKRSSFVATLATVALSISAILVGVTSANASVTVPKGAFLPCSAGGGAYCIDSVSITPTGGKAIALTWVASGTQGATAGNTNGVASGKALPGRWSADGAFANENYDGLYIEAQAANEFVPWIMLDAKPTYSPGNNVSHSQVKTRRRWNPNIQRIKTLVGGTAKRQNVCTSCLKAGKVSR